MTRRERVRYGRVRGYRPSVQQLEELLQLAQKELGNSESSADFTSTVGEYKLTTDDGIKTVSPEHLRALIKDAGNDVRELDNFVFVIKQDDPKRYIRITVGPGDWTEYAVESDSDTWTIGRYYELTEKLLFDCTLYARFKAPKPSILVKKRGQFSWETLPWKSVEDWRVKAVGAASSIPDFLPFPAVFIGIIAFLVYLGDTKVERHKYLENLNHFINSGGLAASLAILLIYAFVYISLRRWRASQLKSKTRISSSSVLAKLTFRETTDPVQLASMYAAAALVLVTLASIFH